MANKKKNVVGRPKKDTRKTKNRQRVNLTVIGIIIFSVLLAAILYTNSGTIGQKVNEILGGMFGIIRYVIPIATFLAAIKIASTQEEETMGKLLQYLLLLICVAIVISVFEIGNGNIEVDGDLSQNLKKAYTLGTGNVGGGAIGSLAAIFLVRMLGNIGAIILSVGATLMLFAFIYGIDIAEYINTKTEEHEELKESRRRQREEHMAQRRTMYNKRQEETKSHMNEEISAIQDVQNNRLEPEQIKINLNGRVVDGEERETKGVLQKIFKNPKEKPKASITGIANEIIGQNENTGLENADVPNNLFVQEEEQKEDKTKQVLQLEHTISVEEENYIFPPISLLSELEKASLKGGTRSLKDTAAKLQKTLYSFGVSAKVENVTVGPAITRYELKPAEGVRVSKIAN